MYRVSQYNIYLPLHKSNEYLLIQGSHGSYEIVDEQTALILQSHYYISKEQFLDEIFNKFLQKGFITEYSEADELKFISKISRSIILHKKKRIGLTILPTYNCNFRCEYCFERCLQTRPKGWLSQVISRDIVDASFVQLSKYLADGYFFKGIELFGGEPLLFKNKDIVEYICTKADELAIPITCTSNGYEMNKYIDIIKKYKFRKIQITIDGVGEQHDKRRFLAGGQPTFSRIIENIDLALDAGVNIVVRTNINKNNIDSIEQLNQLYRDRSFLENNKFSYYFKTTMKSSEESNNYLSDYDLVKELSIRLGSAYLKLNSVYQMMANFNLNMLKGISTQYLKPTYCEAGLGSYIVDPFGDIYSCLEMVSEQEEKIGVVDVDNQSFSFNETYKRWQNRIVDKMENCQKCKYMLFCGGGCAAEAKINSGSTNNAYCDGFQELFNRAAVETYEEYINNKNDKKQLCNNCDNINTL